MVQQAVFKKIVACASFISIYSESLINYDKEKFINLSAFENGFSLVKYSLGATQFA